MPISSRCSILIPVLITWLASPLAIAQEAIVPLHIRDQATIGFGQGSSGILAELTAQLGDSAAQAGIGLADPFNQTYIVLAMMSTITCDYLQHNVQHSITLPLVPTLSQAIQSSGSYCAQASELGVCGIRNSDIYTITVPTTVVDAACAVLLRPQAKPIGF